MEQTEKILSDYEKYYPDVFHRAVNAIYNNQACVIRHMIVSGLLTVEMMNADAASNRLGKPFPLPYFVKCNDYISIYQHGKRDPQIEEIKQLFKDDFGTDIDHLEVPFLEYGDDLFCYTSKDSIEDVSVKTVDELIAEGYRCEDLELYMASARFDLSRTKELLTTGANCDVVIPSDKPEQSAYSNIELDNHFLYTELPPGYPEDIMCFLQFESYISYAATCAILALFDGFSGYVD